MLKKIILLKENKINTILFLLFSLINTLFVYQYNYFQENYIFIKEIVFIFNYIMLSIFGNKLLNKAKNYFKNIKDKNNFINIVCIILRKVQFPLNIIIFFTFISWFIKPFFVEFFNLVQVIVLYDYFIEYGFVFLIFFTIYKIFSTIRKEKTESLERKAKRVKDEDQLLKIKYELTIIHGIFRFFNFILLVFLFSIFTKKAGISLTSILAFGSVIVVILGMSSRYFLANIFGGVMILFYRPFNIGDKIKIPEKDIEGIVYNIGWLTVKIKNSHKNTTHIPNSMFSLYHVDNQSAKYGNKIEENFKFNIESLNEVKKNIKIIKTLLTEHKGIDTDESIIVNINFINGNYVNLKIICTTLPTSEAQYSSIKQDLLIKIYEIFKENNIILFKEDNNGLVSLNNN